MRWFAGPKPHRDAGRSRTVRRFLWLPKKLHNEYHRRDQWRCWEFAFISQWCFQFGWRDMRWFETNGNPEVERILLEQCE
jgi:hypothetical protein